MDSSLQTRYGTRPARKKLPTSVWALLASLAALCAALFLWWVQTSESAAKPDFKDLSHEVISADEVSLTFEVVKAPSATAVCALKALDEDRAPAGWTEVKVPPSQNGARSVVHTETFRTLTQANAVTVDSCWAAE